MVTPMRTEIVMGATPTHNVLGHHGDLDMGAALDLRENKRFEIPEGNVELHDEKVSKRAMWSSIPEGNVELYAEKVNNRVLCAIVQAESLRYKLLGGLAVRRLAMVC